MSHAAPQILLLGEQAPVVGTADCADRAVRLHAGLASAASGCWSGWHQGGCRAGLKWPLSVTASMQQMHPSCTDGTWESPHGLQHHVPDIPPYFLDTRSHVTAASMVAKRSYSAHCVQRATEVTCCLMLIMAVLVCVLNINLKSNHVAKDDDSECVLSSAATLDDGTVALGSEVWTRRLYQHFIKPSRIQHFVISPLSLYLTWACIVLTFLQHDPSAVSEIQKGLSLPCDPIELQSQLEKYLALNPHVFLIDRFIHRLNCHPEQLQGHGSTTSDQTHFYSSLLERAGQGFHFQSLVELTGNADLTRLAIAVSARVPARLRHTKSGGKTWLLCANTSVMYDGVRHSRVVQCHRPDSLSLLLVVPDSSLAWMLLQTRLGDEAFSSLWSGSPNGQGWTNISLPSAVVGLHGQDDQAIWDLAAALQSFGVIKPFTDGMQRGPCLESLKISRLVQHSSLKWPEDVALAFHSDPPLSTADSLPHLHLEGPLLMLIRQGSLIHTLASIGHPDI